MEMMRHWETAVDGIQILLCLLILFFLIRNHRRKIKPGLANSKSGPGQDFNLQVFSQAIDQQVELAFSNMLEVAATERRKLDRVLQFQSFIHADHRSPEIRSSSLASDRENSFQHVTETVGPSERQTRIEQLATRGMSTKQISEELKIAMGEVELILSLQKNSD
jgi:hypothetical protein